MIETTGKIINVNDNVVFCLVGSTDLKFGTVKKINKQIAIVEGFQPLKTYQFASCQIAKVV